jgi:hypothetical protein
LRQRLALESTRGTAGHCGACLGVARRASAEQGPKQQGQDEPNRRFAHAPLPKTVHQMTECNLIGGDSSLAAFQAPVLAIKHRFRRVAPVLPIGALQVRNIVLLLRIADAEVPDEGPVQRHFDNLGDPYRIEDRHPANADAFRPCREPQSVNGDGE